MYLVDPGSGTVTKLRRKWAARDDFFPNAGEGARRGTSTRTYMIAVIGNFLVGVGAIALFTTTLRLTRPGSRT
jgi:hypothetical protein